MSQPSQSNPGIVVTNPDPTTAVKEALELAIKNLAHEVDLRFEGDREARQVSAKALDGIIDVLVQKISSMKEQVVQQAASNKELVTQQATSNKELVNQARELTALALTAALQTQEKSAAETRTFIQESIRQLKAGNDESNKTTNEKIEVLREQVTRLGSRIDLAQGGFISGNDVRREERELHRDAGTASTNVWGIVISIIGVLIAATAVISAILLSHK
jgi:polyribonucleotide nucleotidyltransferase